MTPRGHQLASEHLVKNKNLKSFWYLFVGCVRNSHSTLRYPGNLVFPRGHPTWSQRWTGILPCSILGETGRSKGTVLTSDICHLRKEKGIGADVLPAIDSGIITGDAPVSYWPIFFLVFCNIPKSLCET